MWSLQMLGLERTLRGHARCLHALAVSGLLLISSSSDKTVLIWCAETWVCLQSRCRRRGRMMAAYPIRLHQYIWMLAVCGSTLVGGSYGRSAS